MSKLTLPTGKCESYTELHHPGRPHNLLIRSVRFEGDKTTCTYFCGCSETKTNVQLKEVR